MHVKQIIIQGFKSYKDQTVVEPFSPKLNVIVGRNGSGKSNFFAAIRFVLSDAYTQMGREERQALLHEGSGSAVMSAYVELIFDNSDERFPTGRPELVLRRTIGLKKDEYSLDRKNATRTDVMNLLESAGFSRSNPYYIVPQGRVTTLTNMKDGERLNLLKEVAGTQVYEARRTESLKIMNDTDNKRTKIDDLLAYIRERLEELEEEKEELRAYQDKDKERRCLEYTIYSREQHEVNSALEAIDEQRQTGVDETDENRQQFNQAEQQINKLEKRANETRQQINLLKIDKTQLEDERRETAREKAKAELNAKATSDGQSATQAAQMQHGRELRAVKDSIRQKEKELADVLPRYNEHKKKEEDIKAQLDEVEGARQRLYAKQGRTSQFANQKQRDQWLQKELQEINVAIATRKAVRMEVMEEISQLEKEVKGLEASVAELRSQIDSRGDMTAGITDELVTAKDEKEKLMDQRKELWREEARLDSVIHNAQQELDKAERFLNHMMDQNTARGLAAVRRIQKQHKLNGVYGTLAELFEVPDRYKTAVEVTAGASLFHYVVDTDVTATKVMEILQREKAGRVTFMPLNRLKNKPVNIPKASDAVHMISKLKFDPKYEEAFQHVFGKTIICPNLQVAAQYARSHSLSAITPEGDRADKKGALTGGFHDPRQSRLDAMHTVAKKREEAGAFTDRMREIRSELERKDQEISRCVGEVQKVEQRKQRLESSFGEMAHELRSANSNLQARLDTLEKKKRAKENVDAAARELAEQQEAYEQEMSTPYAKNLNAGEEKQLQSLTKRAQAMQTQFNERSVARRELESQKTLLEVELKENLRLRLDQLNAQGIEIGAGKVDARLRECEKELDRLDKSLKSVEGKLKATEEAIEQASGALAETERSIMELQKRQEELTRAVERYQKKMEKSMARKAILADKAAECSRNIRDLGVLPKEAFDKYQKIQSDKAIKRLHKVNEALKKYSHVNKKAFEQYANFTKQRDTLTQRRSELDNSHKSIEDLIGVLDQRKDEAIERTFKQVSREFATVFEKLVPAGKGRLVIQRKSDRTTAQNGGKGDKADGNVEEEEDEGDEDSDAERRESVENYIGVGISVSFNSKHDDQQRIQQLSGGQKSLCALALVFAIQQCDPAPFYLFDEIDANLDAQYRTAVAQMLKNISEKGEGGQFICTTFRPEVVHVAEKCYGVAYSNKTSSIDVVNKSQALEFVEGQKQ